MRRAYFGCFFAIIFCAFNANAVDIQQWQTEQGTPVYFLPAQDIPMIDVRIVFSAGSARERIAGVAGLSNGLLMTGAGRGKTARDTNQIADDLAQIGAQLSTSAHRDMAVVSLRTLSDEARLTQAVSIMTDVVAHPTYPKADFEREKQRLLLGLKNQKKQPSAQASRAFYNALYGAHPYASLSTTESVNKILRLHVERFHSRYYVSNNAVIAIVGNVSRKRAEQIANQITAQLPKGQAIDALPTPKALAEAVEQFIDLDTQQSHLLLGQLGVARNDPDYYDLYVGNHILGGSGFASKLMQTVREDCGLAYSVYSYFSPMQVAGPFVIGMQTQNENRERALRLLRRELAKFVSAGPSQKELDKALKNITGSAPMRTDSNGKLVEYLAMIGFYQLPLDYLDTFNAKVSAVTPQSIKAVWQKRIKPDKLVSIVVGESKDKWQTPKSSKSAGSSAPLSGSNRAECDVQP